MVIITPFNFEGAAIRLVQIHGNPWFVAADVCEVLTIANPSQAVSRLDDDERTLITVEGASNGLPVNVINESGLYSLIFTSRKPEAKNFKKWVTSEVLPAIRKTGSYTLAMPRTIAQALRLAAEQAEQIEVQQVQLAIAAPKAAFVDQYVDTRGLKGFRQVSKLLQVKENHFREFLVDKKIMYSLGGEWMPHSAHLDAGRFEVKAGSCLKTGHDFTEAKFTPKGIEWIAELIADEGIFNTLKRAK